AVGAARQGGACAPARRSYAWLDATQRRGPAPGRRHRRPRGGAAGITVKHLPSALSTAAIAVIATLAALLPRPAVAQSTTPTFVQGAAFSSGSRVSTITVTLSGPVAQGDLLVGWFAQYNAPRRVQVAGNVNGP